MSTPTPFYLWWITDPDTGVRRRTTYRMEAATALERFPGAEPDRASIEIRNLPDSPDEIHTIGDPRPDPKR